MIQQIIAIIFLLAGFFVTAIAVIGVLRLPDFYTRLHALGKVESFGLALTLTGLAVYSGFSLTSVKLLLIAAFIMLANPVGTYILAKAAYQAGVAPWTRKEE